MDDLTTSAMSSARDLRAPSVASMRRWLAGLGGNQGPRFMSRLLNLLLGLTVLLGSALAHADTVTYVYTDPQGTPLAQANASGMITATFDYKPYGSQALGSSKSGPGYTGHVNDPDTGFVYMQARYYDPAIGRFLAIDPLAPKNEAIMTFGRYNYSNDNPIKYFDPNGKSPATFEEATQLATDLNRRTESSGSTGAYSVVWNGQGPNGYSVQMSTQAAQDHAGLTEQASADYQGKGTVAANALCITPSVAAALIVGDISTESGKEGVNGVKENVERSEKVLKVLEEAPSDAVKAMAKGLNFPSPFLKAAVALPAAVDNQKSCVTDTKKDAPNRDSFKNWSIQ